MSLSPVRERPPLDPPAVSTPATPPRRFSPWLILAFICIPVFVGSLDLTIVSAFLPEIIVQFELPIQAVVGEAAWVVTAYLLAYTVSMIFMGRVSDLVGRRRAYLICLIIFIIGSFIVAEVDARAQDGIAGFAFDTVYRVQGTRPEPGSVALLVVIIGRVVQALGAGAIVPVSLALVGDLFPPAKRAAPLGVVGALDTLGWVLGHLYGGIMVNWFASNRDGFVQFFQSIGLNWGAPDWRALFWINLPIALVAIIGAGFALRGVDRQRSGGRFDWLGTLLISGALIGMVVGLGASIEVSATTAQFSELGGLPPYAAPVLAAAALMFIAFIFVELRVRDPVIDLRAFRRRSYSAGLVTNLLVGFCLMIGLVCVPILVNVRLDDATQISQAALQVGILLSAFTIPMAIAAIPGGWLSQRFGVRAITIAGLVIAAVGFVLVWQTWTLEVADSLVAIEMAIIGVGIGLTFSPISAAVLNSADENKLGSASALVITMRLLGMTVSVSFLTSWASARLAALSGAQLGGSTDAFASIVVYANLTVQVLGEIALIGAVVCAVALLPALFMRERREV